MDASAYLSVELLTQMQGRTATAKQLSCSQQLRLTIFDVPTQLRNQQTHTALKDMEKLRNACTKIPEELNWFCWQIWYNRCNPLGITEMQLAYLCQPEGQWDQMPSLGIGNRFDGASTKATACYAILDR